MKLKIISCDDTIPIKQNFNKCLYITATQSLRRFRIETEELADFFNEDNRIISFGKYKAEILALIQTLGGHITNRDQQYILSKVIEAIFAGNKEKSLAFQNIKKEISKLYSVMLQRGIKRIDAEQLAIIEQNYISSTAEVFRLFNAFVDRLYAVSSAQDKELFQFNNQEGKFSLHHEAYSAQQRAMLKAYDIVILDGFLFFDDYQRQLIFDAFCLGKQIIILTKENDFLKSKLYEPLLKELGADAEFITVPPTKASKNNLMKISENLFTEQRVSDLNGVRFIEPFISREYEYKFIISEISKKLKAESGGTIEGVKKVLDEIAIVGRRNLAHQQIISEALKEEGVFFLKSGKDNLPLTIYSKDEFLKSEIINPDGTQMSYRDKLQAFKDNYSGLKIDIKKRSFIHYPIGQFICEIYRIIAEGMTLESYKKLLYSNWHYNIKAADEKYDRYIKDFSTVQAFFEKLESIDDWLTEIGSMISYKEKIDADIAYTVHPLRAVTAESLLFIQTHLSVIKAIVGGLSAINGTLSEHISGLKTLFEAEQIREQLKDEDNEEQQVVKEILTLVDNITETSMLNMDARYFAKNIKSMLLEYEQEAAEDPDYDICLKLINLENVIPYKTVYFPMLEYNKYPATFEEEFPFTRSIKSALNIVLGIPQFVHLDADYRHHIEHLLFKNVFSFTTETLIITHSQTEGCKPMLPSVYIEDIFSLADSDVTYEKLETAVKESGQHSLLEFMPVPFKMRNCGLADLLLFNLCPKLFYMCNQHQAVYKDAFQLGLFAGGITYHQFFECLADKYSDRVFSLDRYLAATVRTVLKDLMKSGLPGFELLSNVELNNIYQKSLKQIEQFLYKTLSEGQFKALRFSFALTEPDIIDCGEVKITVPRRIVIKNEDSGQSMQFDRTKSMEFLLVSGSGKKYEFDHYDQILNQLREWSPEDDRISLVNHLYFKLVAQFCYPGRKYKGVELRAHGIERIKALVEDIQSHVFNNMQGLPNDYCKCCKVKSTCREFEGGRFEG